jgi:TldD protein
MDFLNYATAYAQNYLVGTLVNCGLSFSRQQKVFASTDGSTWSQTTYLSGGAFSVTYHDDYVQQLGQGGAGADFLSPAGKGWEHISESGLIDEIPRLLDEAEQSRHVIPVEVNRYDTVFSAQAMASLLDNTLGAATELDRAMGYEANADGTSYLNEPLEMLGTYSIGNSAINVTGNRSLVGGCATVKWDDESFVPDDFTLVKDGVLVDFQTTREQADWLAPYYKKINHPVKSHGCAGSESALTITMQHAPNLQLMPAATDTSFDALVADVKKGVAVMSVYVSMDQQQLNGIGYPSLRKIVDGKLGPYIMGAGIQFRGPQMWKNLAAVGGAKETRWFGLNRGKGQPWQNTTHSVGAVPARINNVDVIDIRHKN